MLASVESLDRDALVSILGEPRNALLKQFRKLFEIDSVDLVFSAPHSQAFIAPAPPAGGSHA
jgi:ATP-dependent protease Clp ATPase subunit